MTSVDFMGAPGMNSTEIYNHPSPAGSPASVGVRHRSSDEGDPGGQVRRDRGNQGSERMTSGDIALAAARRIKARYALAEASMMSVLRP